MTIFWKRSMSILMAILCLSGVASLFLACETTEDTSTQLYNVDDLEGKKIAVLTGSVFDSIAQQYIKNPELVYVENNTDLCVLVDAGKADAFIADGPIARYMMNEYTDLKVFHTITNDDYGFIFNLEKGSKLCSEFNSFLADIKANGVYEEMDRIWFGTDDSLKVIDYSKVQSGKNGKIVFGTASVVGEPFVYVKNNNIVGFDVDLIARFCEAYGYALEIQDYSVSGLLAGVQSGRVDVGSCCIIITEERKNNVLFSDPYYLGGTVIVTKNLNQSTANLDGKRIGILTGSIFDLIIGNYIQNPQYVYTDSFPDGCLMLNTKKIDALVVDEPIARYLKRVYPDYVISDVYENDNYGFIFQKGSSKGELLQSQMNELLNEIKNNGVLEKLDSKWFGSDESIQTIDFSKVEQGKNGKLIMATSTAQATPFAFSKNNQIVGYDVEIAVMFCEKFGYALEIADYSFNGVQLAVQNGKADFGGSFISITEERAMNMLFSEPDYYGGIVTVTKRNTNEVSLDDLAGQKIGIMTGTILDGVAEIIIDKPSLVYVDGSAELGIALSKKKIMAFLTDEPIAKSIMSEYENFTILQTIEKDNYGFVFNKENEKSKLICQQMNEFLAEINSNGIREQIENIWLGNDESKKVIDYSRVTGDAPNGTIVLATTSTGGGPFSYLKNGMMVGYEIDIVVRFCERYGYSLKIDDYSFSGLISAVQGEKADLACGCITITEERKEKVLFSDGDYEGGIVIVVRKETVEEDTNQSAFMKFINNQVDSFNSTFVKENRWQLFLEGIGNTMLITVLSIVFGTIIGFLLFVLGYLTGNGFDKVFSIISRLVQGMPVVVLLMILFYVVFVKTSLSAVIVSIVGFTLIFTTSVYGMLKMGTLTVNKVQTEASLALGFTKFQTLWKIILPQALQHILPQMKIEVVTLIKATAIVGYIAVQDLTKISDIVRSRTYEAFFPLIVTAIIYFLLEFILTFIVRSIQINTNPKRRKPETIMKGIDLK